ncbi:hypothetical protein GCM10027271_16390 [Saccharopolyspora gloriosae]
MKPKLATVKGRAVRCVVCGHDAFWSREVKLNSSGAELISMAWANQSAVGLICADCGYVHEFAGKRPKLWSQKRGYPEGAK